MASTTDQKDPIPERGIGAIFQNVLTQLEKDREQAAADYARWRQRRALATIQAEERLRRMRQDWESCVQQGGNRPRSDVRGE